MSAGFKLYFYSKVILKDINLETFTKTKVLITNPDFTRQRINALKSIDYTGIDYPIQELIKKISAIEYCFTMQSCYGHFLYKGQTNFRNTEEIPITSTIHRVDYRIAYLAICIRNCTEGKYLLGELSEIPLIDPEYIQFGCAEWFWERQVNSYVLQVEPQRFAERDKITVGYDEALHIEKTRNKFFNHLEEIFRKQRIRI